MNETITFGGNTFYKQPNGGYASKPWSHPVVAIWSQANVVKSAIGYEPLAKSQVSKRPKARIDLRISQFTRRRQDPDNCCPKYEIDWLRSKGFISDDTDNDIILTILQIQVTKKEDEGVLIEIL